MTKLLWDQVGYRFYETGIDHGVLYLEDGSAVPWNGLVSVQEVFGDDTTTPYYVDGIKFNDSQTTGDFAATLKAITFPEEFQAYEGIYESSTGLYVDGQANKLFNLSYRTLIGSDMDGDAGYKIHILYGLIAIPEPPTYTTIAEKPSILQFSWKLVGTPQDADRFRPTSHVIVDSRYTNPYLLAPIEEMLYGSDAKDALLPTLSDLVYYVDQWDLIEITDNHDGTWGAVGPDEMVVLLDDTTFQISNIDVEWLDTNTYKIKTTTLEEG